MTPSELAIQRLAAIQADKKRRERRDLRLAARLFDRLAVRTADDRPREHR